MYTVEDKSIARFGTSENRTVTIDTTLTFNNAVMPKLYGEIFLSQNLNTYQWYQTHNVNGSGFPMLVLGNDFPLRSIRPNEKFKCGQMACAQMSIARNKLCKPGIKTTGEIHNNICLIYAYFEFQCHIDLTHRLPTVLYALVSAGA